MGEIADAMLDGTLCECCGTYIGEGDGFPQYCSDYCAKDRGVDLEPAPGYHRRAPEPPTARYPKAVKEAKVLTCQIDGCGKRFASEAAKRSHRKMKHGRPA